MDPPGGLPEGSSPVVLPASPQLTLFSTRTEVTTNSGTTRTTRRIGTTSNSSSFSLIGPNVASSAGPTTRSRYTRSRPLPPIPPVAFPPPSVARASRKRKAPTSSEEKKPKAARNRKKPPPGNLKKAPPKSDNDEDKKPAAKINCCICMDDVEPKDQAKIDGCDHRFCFGCIEKWSERENKCPLCKCRFHKIDRIHKKGNKKGTKNTKKVKQKDQRSDISSGAALEGLIANLRTNSGSLARIIFGMEFGGTAPAAAISTARSAATGIRAEFADSSDSSDDESPMASFMRALHGSTVANGISMSTTVVRPMTFQAHFSAPTRSFARNIHDYTAGRGADNPLEIDDDSVEEVIEID